jgi:hypothetical protein
LLPAKGLVERKMGGDGWQIAGYRAYGVDWGDGSVKSENPFMGAPSTI